MIVYCIGCSCGSARHWPNHPSTETRQLQWEKDMEKATRQMHRNIHQHEAGRILWIWYVFVSIWGVSEKEWRYILRDNLWSSECEVCVICQMRFTHRGLPPRTCRYDTSRRPKTLQQMNCQFTAAPPIPTLSQSFLLRNYPSSWISVPTLDTIGCAFSYTLESFIWHLLENLGIRTFRISECQKPPIRHRIRLVIL